MAFKGSQGQVASVPTVRSAIVVLLALALVGTVPIPSGAQTTPSITGGCQSVSDERVGTVRACDHDRNAAPESVRYDIGLKIFDEDERREVVEGHVVADEQRRRTPWSTEQRYDAEVLARFALPMSPTLHYAVHARDEGDDGNIEHLQTRGGAYANGIEDRNARYFLGLWDFNEDGRLETWGAQGCTHETGCEAPDLRSVPDPPSLPDPTFHIEPVGWIP